jgi:hypothetical protein
VNWLEPIVGLVLVLLGAGLMLVFSLPSVERDAGKGVRRACFAAAHSRDAAASPGDWPGSGGWLAAARIARQIEHH